MTLTIRVTQAEKDAIIVNAMHAGKNLTDYILSVNDRAIISPPPDLSPLLRELKRIGTNINQVAAKVNSGVSYVPGLREVAEQQAEIIRRLRALTDDRTANAPGNCTNSALCHMNVLLKYSYSTARSSA